MRAKDKEDGPVFESTLKKDDFPTLGRPGLVCMDFVVAVNGSNERTDDADLEVVAWTTEQNFFLLSGGLFWRHFFRLCLRCERDGERASQKTKSINHEFVK